MVTKAIDIIGAEFGWGAKRHETQFGPGVFKESYFQALKEKHPEIFWRNSLKPQELYTKGKTLSYPQQVEQVRLFSDQLAEEVAQSQQKHFSLVLGGDHSIAIGTWSGLTAALQAPGEFGLIWVDAHMDSHTPKTTPSRAIHGMPLAVLMGYGERTLTNLRLPKAKLNPKNVALIGVRSYEPGEAELLKRLNVRVYFMDEIKKRGFDIIFLEAVKHVSENVKGFGLSLDLDAFDPSVAPGVGSPEENGLHEQEVHRALKSIKDNPLFKALEIAEYNPERDIQDKTAVLIQGIIESLI